MQPLTFDRKMIRFISRALILATSGVILVSAGLTVTSITNKSTQMAMKEVEVMTTNTEDNFKQYHQLIWAIMLDRHIQTYMQAQDPYPYLIDANSVLDNVCNMWENVNFISVIPAGKEYHLIKGNGIPHWKTNYKESLEQDYEQGIPMQQKTIKMSFSSEYDMNGSYTLNLYYPLYSSKVMDQQLGILCVNVDDANLSQLMSGRDQEAAVDTYFVHKDGTIISSTDESKLGTEFVEMQLKGEQKTTMTLGNLIIYKKLADWDFYYVTRISWWELLSDSVRNIVTLALLLVLMLVVTVRLAHRLVIKAYEPWGNVVKAMGQVSKGALKTRLPAEETDPDMEVVAKGFNSMMGQMVKLMDQIKEEQYQMDQIRMEALQSQIQPHFLYNTLDCIHWQAVVSGNQDISKLVKALASYYRICLSRGKDIITLKEELTYTKNYLYIQQIRYQEILNYEITMDERFDQAVIPKLTLQPLVENAIYHGIKQVSGRMGAIQIKVIGTQVNDQEAILLTIKDNGVGMTEERIKEMNASIAMYDEEFGYGVRNVNRRLQLYYGSEYGLTYSKNEPSGVTVNVLLPNWHEMKPSVGVPLWMDVKERGRQDDHESIDS